MDKYKEIRPVVLGVVRNGDKILVSTGYDEIKKQSFYRCIGGGIEFLEKSQDALKREFKEELGIDVKVKEYLGLTENIFVYNGKNAHELIFLYNVSINKKDIKEQYHILDEVESDAIWVDAEKFKNKELILYPELVIKYL